eukprot:4703906-Prymnesium_polylepis.2
MLPGIRIFLDVDDLEEISDLEGYVRRSEVVLVYMSADYFHSKNCMRELTCAFTQGKPLLAVEDCELDRGGLSLRAVREQLIEAEARYGSWGFGQRAPRGAELCDALLSADSSPQPRSQQCHRVEPARRVSAGLVAIAGRAIAPHLQARAYCKVARADTAPDDSVAYLSLACLVQAYFGRAQDLRKYVSETCCHKPSDADLLQG